MFGFTWLVDSTIFPNLLLPAPKRSYEIIKRKHKLPQKRRVFLENLPVEALYPGPLRQRHDALLLPEKKSKGKKLHELLQNATNALCLLLCLTLRLGQEQPMRSEIHSTCVCIHRGTALTSLRLMLHEHRQVSQRTDLTVMYQCVFALGVCLRDVSYVTLPGRFNLTLLPTFFAARSSS